MGDSFDDLLTTYGSKVQELRRLMNEYKSEKFTYQSLLAVQNNGDENNVNSFAIYPDSVYTSSETPTVTRNVESANDCAMRCAETGGCKGGTWGLTTKNCSTFKTLGQITDDNANESTNVALILKIDESLVKIEALKIAVNTSISNILSLTREISTSSNIKISRNNENETMRRIESMNAELIVQTKELNKSEKILSTYDKTINDEQLLTNQSLVSFNLLILIVSVIIFLIIASSSKSEYLGSIIRIFIGLLFLVVFLSISGL